MLFNVASVHLMLFRRFIRTSCPPIIAGSVESQCNVLGSCLLKMCRGLEFKTVLSEFPILKDFIDEDEHAFLKFKDAQDISSKRRPSEVNSFLNSFKYQGLYKITDSETYIELYRLLCIRNHSEKNLLSHFLWTLVFVNSG